MSRAITCCVLVALALTLGACTSDSITYVDRDPFNPPPDSLSGFLGYFTVETRKTTCGNCHVGTQRDWRASAHAGAFDALATNPNTQPACYGCHTVSERGNSAAAGGPAGYNRVGAAAYRDVQCESCHGPGLPHVLQPDVVGNQPRAYVDVIANAATSCANCHSGSHQPFAEEWGASRHGGVVASPAANPSCQSCHEGRAALAAFGVRPRYVETGSTTPMAITCAVCHDPHGSPNNAQLRFPVNTPDPEQNLCMKCHMRRNEPVPGQARPHAPQGSVILGTAGYRPAGFDFNLVSSHGPLGNPGLCATCHVSRFEVSDPATGGHLFSATGHLFRPIPCLDANGVPNADKTCAYTETDRSFRSCTTAGCHLHVSAARSAFQVRRANIKSLADVLWIDSNGNGNLDAFPTDQGYLPRIRAAMPTEFTTTTRVTAAQGAEFNVRLAGEGFQGNTDNSKGVHHPFLLEALVRASTDDVLATYPGIVPAPPASIEAILDSPLGGRPWLRPHRAVQSRAGN
jgi:predicted CXXCH cytochrome family protein